ncbi:hypothetical protein [Rhizobium leguminosarum]|uniref:hypothetical protein n=1 Tax=Rhizobium leguminosarum TaxID=384 RepID=UPI00104057FB|nr:hypothetical protein [Rhizobium leguminosarum]TBZ28939.1 hypothetical protein E0H44_36725 [Rhizobium leguminosarum bv. viciae]TCA03163.1 hypothetical protein E0H68_35065 [Rhizobium leguminosarum bv. viciae]TCA14527.1 hypothetical protein E0H67_35895 [Rhizobium leguminosarum bv. viciae]
MSFGLALIFANPYPSVTIKDQVAGGVCESVHGEVFDGLGVTANEYRLYASSENNVGEIHLFEAGNKATYDLPKDCTVRGDGWLVIEYPKKVRALTTKDTIKQFPDFDKFVAEIAKVNATLNIAPPVAVPKKAGGKGARPKPANNPV